MSVAARPVRRLGGVVVVLLALLIAPALFAQAISDQARQQIGALLAEKESRTPAQRKLDSNLLYAARMQRGSPVANGVGQLITGIDVAPDASTVVDITAYVSDDLLGKITALGGTVLDFHEQFRSVRARLPLQALEALAAEPAVIFIQPKQEAMTWRQIPFPPGPPKAAAAAVSPVLRKRLPAGFEERAERLRAKVAFTLAGRSASTDGGPLGNKVDTSEGDVTHRANLVRSTYGITGAGVKVGVLSDGVSSLASIQASGDLPGVTVLPGQQGDGDEGTAMLEIVYDLAPGAQLYFASAFGSIAQFAQNILDLQAAGCDVIVDDVFFFVETPFQKGQAPSVVSTTNAGLIIQAVNTVTAAGALYFSSAGNSGNLTSATSGTWEGDYVDGGAVGSPITGTGNFHNFGAQNYDVITSNGSAVSLHWSDPLGGSSNDYDLFLLDSTGTSVLASSTNPQSGTQDPFELMGSELNDRIVIVRRTGASGRFLHLATLRGRLSISTASETHGHSAPPGPYAFGVAATPAAGPIGAPPNPTGPFPGSFNISNSIELFSSDGPRRFFFNADSSAITPGNFSATGGEVQNKPDVTAADGVACAAPGFNPFYGTSAAAPHAAAIAALVKSAAPGVTQAQWKGYLLTGAIDIMTAGVDRNSGVGILDALPAVEATGITMAQASLTVGTLTFTEATGDGDGVLEPGECGALTVPVINSSGIAGATGVTATLTSSTPGVTIVVGTASYGNIAANGTATNPVPFRVELAISVLCPASISFTLSLSLSGGPSPQVRNFEVTLAKAPVVVSTTLDGTVPPAGPGLYTAATGTQTGRINRFSPPSGCGIPKTNPGAFSTTGSRMYDAYTFQNCSQAPACITVTLNHPGFNSPIGNQLFSAAYDGSFNPADPTQNYLADAGASGQVRTYSFDVAAGQTFVVVVHEVTGGSGPNPYTLTVAGGCLPCQSYTTTYSCCPAGALTIAAPATVGAGSPNRVASVPNHAGSTYAWIVSNGTITGGQGSSQITFTAGASGSVGISVVETLSTGCQQSGNVSVPIAAAGSAVLFYTVAPCRQLDTRTGPGTPFAAAATQTVALTGAPCGIPVTALAVSVNLTVTQPTAAGYLTIYPADGTQPLVSNINFVAGQTRANNATLRLATDGSGGVKVFNGSLGTTHVILDVNGYFQ